MGVDLDAERVEVPDTPNPLNAEQMDELRELVNPLAPGDDLGISLYARTCMAVQSFISYIATYSAILATVNWCTSLIGASEAKPLSSGWYENRKFGSLGGWVLRRVNTKLYGITFVRRVHTIDGTYVVHIPILVHTSSLERF